MADKKYIDADLDVSGHVTVWECNCSEFGKQTVMAVDDLYYLPAADVVEVVRCKDCKYWSHETVGMIDHYECDVFCGAYGRGYMTGADDFCSYGERKAATQ